MNKSSTIIILIILLIIIGVGAFYVYQQPVTEPDVVTEPEVMEEKLPEDEIIKDDKSDEVMEEGTMTKSQ